MMTSVVSWNYSVAMSKSFSDQPVWVLSFKARAKDWSKSRESETPLFFRLGAFPLCYCWGRRGRIVLKNMLEQVL